MSPCPNKKPISFVNFLNTLHEPYKAIIVNKFGKNSFIQVKMGFKISLYICSNNSQNY